jgi:hypothetical protein
MPSYHTKPAAQDGADGRKVVIAGGIGDLTQSLVASTCYELRIGRKNRGGACIVAAAERIEARLSSRSSASVWPRLRATWKAETWNPSVRW